MCVRPTKTAVHICQGCISWTFGKTTQGFSSKMLEKNMNFHFFCVKTTTLKLILGIFTGEPLTFWPCISCSDLSVHLDHVRRILNCTRSFYSAFHTYYDQMNNKQLSTGIWKGSFRTSQTSFLGMNSRFTALNHLMQSLHPSKVVQFHN